MTRLPAALAGLALLLSPLALSGQWTPTRDGDPVTVVAESADRVRGGFSVRVDIAPGWYVYGVDATSLGLPLSVVTDDGEPLPVRTLHAPDTTAFEGTAIPVHRGLVELRVDVSELNHPRYLRVRWAACRGDLCIPRETRVQVAGSRPAPTS